MNDTSSQLASLEVLPLEQPLGHYLSSSLDNPPFQYSNRFSLHLAIRSYQRHIWKWYSIRPQMFLKLAHMKHTMIVASSGKLS